MIQYTLKCDQAHSFDSWFKSSEAFDKLAAGGLLSCAVCGSADVAKALMSPRVASARTAPTGRGEAGRGEAAAKTPGPVASDRRPLAVGAHPDLRRALAEIRKRVELESDYVGERFVQEARAMHLGEAPERSIYGEATASDARQLVEDGVPVMPLPFIPVRKTN